MIVMNELPSMTQLALLLTAKWAVNDAKPLTNPEFLGLRRWLGAGSDAASELMNGQRKLEDCPIEHRRLQTLLQRALGVFQPVDRWMQAGLWIRSWSDTDYPSRFKQLRLRAPSLLFGYGNPEAFSERALAIVGSRNASDERLAKAAEIGRACARNKITVVSGGARGIDAAAMKSGMAGGGTVVGVLADSLLKESGKRDYREAIMEKRLCLMSEVSPEAPFNVGNAMSRNRLAYACADAALVIECDIGRGGTWQGAMEARNEGKTVYVLRGARAERQLADLGAVIIDIDFALHPEKLITGLRPDSTTTSTSPFTEWLHELLVGSSADIEKLVIALQSDLHTVAHHLVCFAEQEGIMPPLLPDSNALPEPEGSSLVTKHKRRTANKKSNGTDTLFDGEVAKVA